MDNLASYKVTGVAEFVHSVGAELLYLPPYSPNFKPFELLQTAIPQAFSTITVSDAHGWFTASGC